MFFSYERRFNALSRWRKSSGSTSSLLLPKAEERRLVVAHDGPGIRAADKGTAVAYQNASV
jgi:hypothetical protein